MTTTKKGVARVATNIKSMTGVPPGAIASLPVDGYVLGNMSPSGTDLIDIVKWFRPSGQEIPLDVPCKASIANLTVTDFVDPVEPPPPPPDGEQVFDVTLHDSVTGKTYSGTLTEDVVG